MAKPPSGEQYELTCGFPPRLLTDMTLRRFGLSACTANPEDLPPSLAQHGSCWRPSTSPPLSFQDTRARSCSTSRYPVGDGDDQSGVGGRLASSVFHNRVR